MGAEEPREYAVDADVILAFESRGMRLAPSAGLIRRTTRLTATWYEVSYSAAMARLLGGTNSVPWNFSAARSLRLQHRGATADAGFLFGAEAMARLAAPLSPRSRLVVATRANLTPIACACSGPRRHGLRDAAVRADLGLGLAWDWTS